MPKKILYIGQKITKVESGADVVNFRNIHLLYDFFGKENVFFIQPKPFVSFWDKISFYLAGLDRKKEQEVIDFLEKNSEVEFVFLSQSLVGRQVEKIKKKFKNKVKIITFFHNIEKHYAREYLKTSGLRAFLFYFGAVYNEKKAVKYSDKFLLLNQRDNEYLQKEYNTQSDFILPVSVEDKFSIEKIKNSSPEEPVYLFVGVNFFANVNAVEWFIEKVLPYVKGKLKIVGKGMETHKEKWQSDRVEVYGFVEDISEFYYASSLVIAPIFVGGGMKTKTAEALMYGKTIVGTLEAFQGYVQNHHAMKIAHTKEEFIKILNSEKFLPYNEISRQIFCKHYKNDIILETFKKVF